MATLQTQYKNYLLKNPDHKITYTQWLEQFSEKLRIALQDINPQVSDDFQIGPNGAYEHSDRKIDFQATINFIANHLQNVKYSQADLSDIGNEVGLGLGTFLKDLKQSEIDEFIFGIKHGISLTNGTH
jgi:hypothetical protein